MLRVSNALEKAIGGAQNRNRNFRTIDQRSEAFVMALAGFAEEHRFDWACGAQRFFDHAYTLDADEAGFRGQSTTQREAKFLQPAVVPAGDRGRRTGTSRSASGFARRGHTKGSVANFPAKRLIQATNAGRPVVRSAQADGGWPSVYIYAAQVFIAWA